MFDPISDLADDLDREYEELLASRRRSKHEKDWVKALAEPDWQDDKTPATPSDPLDAYLQAALERTRRDVTELESEVDVRQRLHEQSLEQLDYQIGAAAHSLTRFRYWGLGYNRGVDQKRTQLEERLDGLRREKRAWRVRFWRDVVELRASLRQARRDYEAAVRRSRVLLG